MLGGLPRWSRRAVSSCRWEEEAGAADNVDWDAQASYHGDHVEEQRRYPSAGSGDTNQINESNLGEVGRNPAKYASSYHQKGKQKEAKKEEGVLPH